MGLSLRSQDPSNSQCSFLFKRGRKNSESVSEEEAAEKQPTTPASSLHPWATADSWQVIMGPKALRQMSTHLFCSSAQKLGRKTAGRSRRGAPWDPSASEEREGSPVRSPAAAHRRHGRVSSLSGKCCLYCLVYASGTSRLPVSLGLFLPVPRGLLISFQALSHSAVPKKSKSGALTARAEKGAV